LPAELTVDPPVPPVVPDGAPPPLAIGRPGVGRHDVAVEPISNWRPAMRHVILIAVPLVHPVWIRRYDPVAVPELVAAITLRTREPVVLGVAVAICAKVDPFTQLNPTNDVPVVEPATTAV
jgi:hypothetical protein